MSQSFTLKSYHNGLSIHMKEDVSLDVILNEIGNKFESSRAFFGTTKVALSLSGKELTETEQMMIIDKIQMHSDLDIVCLAGEDENLQMLFDNALTRFELHKPLPKQSPCNAQIQHGNLVKGNVLESEYTVVILGDVNPGAKIITQKDVIILGSLFGEIQAGNDHEDGHFIAALDMSPERIRIGDFKYHKNKHKRLWPDTGKKLPKIAFVKDGEVLTDNITKELLGQIISNNMQ